MSEDDIRSKTFRPKVAEIRKGQLEGHIDPAWNPTELILLITDIARMLALKSTRSIPRRREAAVEAVRRLIGA